VQPPENPFKFKKWECRKFGDLLSVSREDLGLSQHALFDIEHEKNEALDIPRVANGDTIAVMEGYLNSDKAKIVRAMAVMLRLQLTTPLPCPSKNTPLAAQLDTLLNDVYILLRDFILADKKHDDQLDGAKGIEDFAMAVRLYRKMVIDMLEKKMEPEYDRGIFDRLKFNVKKIDGLLACLGPINNYD
jgi:hypothetical protein